MRDGVQSAGPAGKNLRRCAIIESRIPFVIVVSGPSGAGKSTVAGRVAEALDDVEESISYTTRPPRGEETQGKEYFFVSRGEFEQMVRRDEFIEWAEVYGNLYGSSAEYVRQRLEKGKSVILEIDVQGGKAVKKKFDDAALIMVLPPSIEELENRLRGRKTDAEQTIAQRLANARNEIFEAGSYDYIVINSRVDRCVEDIIAVIRAEMMRRNRVKLIKNID